MTLRALHRYAGLIVGGFWCFQALTGVVLVFHSEIEDALLQGPSLPLDANALAGRITALQAGDCRVDSVWASGTDQNRYDIFCADSAGRERAVRIDGAANVLRDSAREGPLAAGRLFDALGLLHEELLAGAFGRWIVGISGMLLLINLLVGLSLAWPRLRAWRQAFTSRPGGSGAAYLLGWHRLIGAWSALAIIVIIATGAALSFRAQLELLPSAAPPHPSALSLEAAGAPHITPPDALRAAFGRYPAASLTALVMPTDETPWYRIRLLMPDEQPRFWGNTTVFVDAVRGDVLLSDERASASTFRRAMQALYPLHTGQEGGRMGRIAVLAFGVALSVMYLLGIASWLKKRRAVAA